MGDVLTWLWQGSLVALVLAAVLRAARALRLTGAMRYALCWWGLGIVLALPLAPAALGALRRWFPAAGDAAALPPHDVLTLPGVPAAVTFGLLAVWALGVAGGVTRLALDLRRLRRLKNRARPMPESLERRLPLWTSVRARGRRPRLAIVDDRIPASVLGFRRPVIVVPRTLLEALDDAELDQVVAHEHAHVARRDDWADLLQRIIAIPLGLHPAVWLIGRWLRRERELAADERVAVRTGTPHAYACCLARVAETMTRSATPSLAPGAAGSRRELLHRVTHLIDDPWAFAGRSARGAIGAAVAVAALTALPLGSRGPAVEIGADGAVATQARVTPPTLLTPLPRAQVAPGGRTRISGARFPSPPAPALLDSRRLDHAAAAALPAATRSTGLRWRRPSPAPLPGYDLGLTAHRITLAPPEGNIEVRESRWAWARRSGTSLGSWFAGAGRTTAGTFRSLGSSLTRTFTGRR